MNREQRLQIWTDETAHPSSPTTQAAMEASGASQQFVDEWADLEGHNESHWMCYLDFIKGAISIAADHDPKTEFESPDLQVNRLVYQASLWEELKKAVGELPHNELGENRDEYDRFITQQRNREEAKAEAAKAQSMLLKQPPSIVSIPGKFYARYDAQNKQVLGFGFMPHASGADYFGPHQLHEDGPPAFETPYGLLRFWDAVRTYLNNVNEISGEPMMAVVWEEDGWTV